METRISRAAVALVVFLALACALSAQAQDEKLNLKLNLKQGQSFRFRLTTASSGAASLSNQSVNTTETLRMGMLFSVESVDQDGSSRLKATFDDCSYNLSTTGQPGANQLFGPISKVFAALSGRSFTLELMPTGVVRSVSGIEAVTSAALQTLAGQPDAIRAIATQTISQSMSEPMWKHVLTSVFAIIPDHPVAIGERWSRDFAVNTAGGSQQGTTYMKVTNRAGGTCNVKIYQDVKSATRQVGNSVTLTFTGTAEGSAEVDEATGLVVRAHSTASLKGKAADATGKGGSSAPMVIRSTSSIERY